MDLTTYTTERLKAAITLPPWQQAPYVSPVEALYIMTDDGVALSATLFSRQHPDLLIICHGFFENQRTLAITWLAEALVDRWDVLTFDWRGYGASGGMSSFGGDEQQDLLAVLRYARARGYRRVGIIGQSMGGLIALTTLGMLASTSDAEQPGVDAIATLGTPADYQTTSPPASYLVRHLVPRLWARSIAPLLGFRMGISKIRCPLDVVSQICVPLLLLHGTRDHISPVRNAYLLHKHAPGSTLRIYEGVGHGVEFMYVQARRRLVTDLRAHFRAM